MIRLVTCVTVAFTLACGLALALGHMLPPTGDLVFAATFASRGYDVYRMDAARGLMVGLTHDPADDISPAWSADGEQIAYVNNDAGQFRIYIMDAQGGQPRRLTLTKQDEYHPAWSPDGRYIAFERLVYRFESVLALAEVHTGLITRLTDTASNAHTPVWSPDSREVIYAADPGGAGRQRIYGMDIQTQTTHLIVPSNAGSPSLSPDSRFIAYIGGSPPNKTLYLWDTQADAGRPLYTTPGLITSPPRWSPDGERLVFAARVADNHLGLFQLRVSACLQMPPACQAEALSRVPGIYTDPQWRPYTS